MEKVRKTLLRDVHGGAESKHEECYGAFKKHVRNSEYSKSENLKKLSGTGPKLLVSRDKIRVKSNENIYQLNIQRMTSNGWMKMLENG